MEGFEIHGIDVSHYQHRIDWDTVATQKVDFAFVKATEGLTYKDSLFQRNWSELKRVGIKRGAYHFYRPNSSPKTQAYNFLSTVSIEEGDLPPVLDFEVVSGQHHFGIISGLQTWLSIVENELGFRPIIYTNLNLYNEYIKDNFNDYSIWIARYNDLAPHMPIDQPWSFWQYGNRGRMKGIEGDVDFNVFSGSHQDLEYFGFPADSSSYAIGKPVYPL